METPPLDHDWYMKSRQSSTNIQGPYSTQQLIQTIKEGLKERVCISGDNKTWYSMHTLFAPSLLASDMVYAILGNTFQQPLPEKWYVKSRMNSSNEQGPFTTKNLLPIIRDAKYRVCISVDRQRWHTIGAIFSPSCLSPTIITKVLFRSLKEKPQQAQATFSLVEESTKETQSKRYPLIIVLAMILTLSVFLVHNYSLKKVKLKAWHKSETTPDPKVAKPQLGKIPTKTKQEPSSVKPTPPQLATLIIKYYRYLEKTANQVATGNDIVFAYQYFTSVKVLQDFCKQQGLDDVDARKVKRLRFANRQANFYAFFYPAWVYEKHQQFLATVDRNQLLQQITNEKQRMAATIADRNNALSINRSLVKQNREIQSTYRRVYAEIGQQDRILHHEREHLQHLQYKIVQKKSQLAEWESKDKKNGKSITQEQYRKNVKRMQSELSMLEVQRMHLQNRVQDLQKNIGNLRAKYKKLQVQHREILAKQRHVEKKLSSYKVALKRLDELVQCERDFAKILKEYGSWWHKSNTNVRAKFILALYVLTNFPSEYYSIEIKKWKGIGGVVEVYFW